jgi:hypothetical protein
MNGGLIARAIAALAGKPELPPLPPSPQLFRQERPFNEAEFLAWYEDMARRQGLASDPDVPDQHYDYRAAFGAGASPDETGHWPSQFKRPGHPAMVVGGFHVQTGERVPGTPRAGFDELVSLGWDPATAAQLAATPERNR